MLDDASHVVLKFCDTLYDRHCREKKEILHDNGRTAVSRVRNTH